MIKLTDLINEAKKLKETFEEFAKTRGAGAAKIAETAEKKGGLALLTWHHFNHIIFYNTNMILWGTSIVGWGFNIDVFFNC